MSKLALAGSASLALVLALGVWAGACSGNNGDVIAQALADRLSSSLEFDGATEEQPAEELPPPNPDPDAAPQITGFKGPGALRPGQRFELQLTTSFASPQDIVGAVIYINGHSSYLRLWASVDEATSTMTISGSLNVPDGLSEAERRSYLNFLEGRTFKIKLALARAELGSFGEVGRYYTWQLGVSQPANRGSLAATQLCERICAYYERCNFEWLSYEGEDYDCRTDCAEGEAETHAEASPGCWVQVVAWVECLLSLSCQEFEAFFEQSFFSEEGSDHACMGVWYRLEAACENDDWWEGDSHDEHSEY